ncbi:calcineurin B [Aphelenchoides avenae]|nr:calcineurin B [Aphelenchus avenae]
MKVEGLKYNPLGPRIVEAFINKDDSTANEIDESAGRINFRQFARVLSRFQAPDHKKSSGTNSREEKLKFVFSMCDLDKDGIIKHSEFRRVLHTVVGNDVSPERLNDIIDRAMFEADFEKNHIISFEEFCKVGDFPNYDTH